MPAAASVATVMPKNLSGVIAEKKPAIQSKTPSCELNSKALIAADATPIKMKMRINRSVRKFCIQGLTICMVGSLEKSPWSLRCRSPAPFSRAVLDPQQDPLLRHRQRASQRRLPA